MRSEVSGRRGRRRAFAAVLGALLLAVPGTLAGCSGAAGSPLTSGAPNPSGTPGLSVTPSPSEAPSLSPVDALIETLRTGPTAQDRADAADGLSALADHAAIPALAAALSDESWMVRKQAAAALETLNDERALDALLALIAVAPASPPVAEEDLVDADEAYRDAMAALGAIGSAAAAPRLVEIAAVEDWTDDSGAAEDALVAIGEPSVPALTAAMESATPALGVVIVGIVAKLAPAGLDAMTAALADSRTEVRLAAIEGLSEYGTAATGPLIGALKDKDGAVRAAAIGALGDLGDTSATAALVGLLGNGDTVSDATDALVRIHQDDAAPLVKYLASRSTVNVYKALIRIGQDDTLTALVKALNSFGGKTMAEAYLNCGSDTLEAAATRWGTAHGYRVVSSGGSGAEVWGDK